jgi:hypothetical protein
MTLTAEQLAEIIRRHPQPRRKKPPEPKPVVTLATTNPEVPLERQRERLSEAQQRLIADEEARLRQWEEEKKRERWIAERQRAIDFHMEMKLANEEAERMFRRNDPCGLWSRAR